ncbi:MAG: sulfatase [Isosphaeraceae bacterium]|nr:sulfatase [Isosphaeraceae bacterium]
MKLLRCSIAISAIWTFACCATGADGADRPNIVWIVGEDMGPELGCYGDPQADTPNIDRLAREGRRYTHAYTHAPVCAPSRSGLVTGIYPTSLGTHHMRSTMLTPPPLFTHELKKAGYFVAWPGKTDFNFAVPKDGFDTTVDWTKKPEILPTDRPFFAYINFTISHESQIRKIDPKKYEEWMSRLGSTRRHDPSRMKLPAYTPDTPETRSDLASYYDLVSVVDGEVGKVLELLDRLGLREKTVVIFTGDHGRGLPRSKRWIYEQGTHVPLIVRWPGTIAPGEVSPDLVSFIDFAPTTLSIAGAPIPERFQGQVVFGPHAAPPRKYVYAARDRMDEAEDRIRGVRDARFRYIRNYHPELPYAQRIAYMEEMPTMRVWRELHAAGKLTPAQELFFAPQKPNEELYDVENDPDEVRNLANDPRHAAKLEELRKAMDAWQAKFGDLGAVPERDLIRRGLVADRLAEYEKRKVKP